MFIPIFNMGNIYTGMNYFNSFNPFSFGGMIPNLFGSSSFMPSFPAPSIFSYMSGSAMPNVDSLAKSIVASTSRSSYNTVKSTGKPTAKKSSQGATVGKNQNASVWAKLGYCAEAGMRLAKTALNSVVGFIGKCCTYVKNAIARCGLGKYENGHAYNMVSIMRKNKKFKEINPSGVNVKTLPAGAVLVYGKGVAGYSSSYGHVEIATGDGRCVSDGVTRNPRSNPTAIFIPVAA